MTDSGRERTREPPLEDRLLFDEREREVLARRWRLFGPILAGFTLASEIPPYFTAEFPHAWELSLPVAVWFLAMGLAARLRPSAALLGWGSVLTGVVAGGYVGTACAETGRFLSPHALGMAALVATIPAVASLDLPKSIAALLGSVAAWALAVLTWKAQGTPVALAGLTTTLTYFAFISVLAVITSQASRALRRRAFHSHREVERVHRFAVEDVLYRHLPRAYVERVLSGSASLDAPPDRRTLTVLFADLVGFTELAETLPNDALGALMARYYELASEVAFAQGATVDKFIGDAVMVLVGAPEPLSSDEQARRAVEVARGLHRAMRELGEQLGTPLVLRIGIHQDQCAVGSFGGRRRSNYTALGRGVNVASRLEQRCRPGETLVTEPVARWVDAAQVLTLGELQLKGVAAPVRCFVVDPLPRRTASAELQGLRS